MELSIARNGNTKLPIHEERKERKEVRRNDKNAKDNHKESMAINTTVVKVLGRGAKVNKKWLKRWQKNEMRCLNFKEWE